MIRFAVLACTLALSVTAALAEDLPYLYPRTAYGTTGGTSVEIESAVGTREAAPFGSDGFEQGLRLRHNVSDRVTVETWTGSLFAEADRRDALSIEAFYGIYGASGANLRWTFGGGYAHDFRGDNILRLRTHLERFSGNWRSGLLAHAEVPFASDRDKADVIVGVTSSWTVGEGRVGIEFLGEDLEGFWDEHEAEGGARLVVGPTFSAPLTSSIQLKANVAGIIQATRNPIPDPNNPGQTIEPGSNGLLARIAMGYAF